MPNENGTMVSKDEVIAALFHTLRLRNECPDCGGQGYTYTLAEYGVEVLPEPCWCTQISDEVMEQYKEEIIIALRAFILETGNEIPADFDENTNELVNELLAERRELK